FSPMGIDSSTKRYKEHREWIISDSEGKPILAQWNHPAFDFVSDFYYLFIDDCKKLIDQGVRFFKWDAINTFFSTLSNLHHGSDRYTAEERRARYEYLLPIYVTHAMKELTDYEPELIIEIDLTEARRVMTGLAVLSAGKYFWMNNGASAYNDYSAYRAKSMRTIPNQFAGIIPLELFTFANYPHDDLKNQRYNVNTSLIAGHGFWGALQFMNQKERMRVGNIVTKSKKALPYIADVTPQIIGKVGASPEIYTQVNENEAAGQVVAFSGQALNYKHHVEIDKNKFLAVLNHSYHLKNDSLLFAFDFPMPDATREAFILPNEGAGISIVSSTCWLDMVELINSTKLVYVNGAPGRQDVLWKKENGKPAIQASSEIEYQIAEDADENDYHLIISIPEPNIKVTIGE
ncbi:hypothetical protein JW964_25570, partial [candidate division KSB1 bacterium]|nr:hypothetical protein [candidate division KSB1 bacterium]